MTEPSTSPDNQSTEADDEISLLDLLVVLARNKLLILGFPFVAALIAAGYSFTFTSIYTAYTKILPPQQSQSASSAMLAQLGGLANLVGGATGIKGPNDTYIAILKSRTVADDLIERFGLMKVYGTDINHPSDAHRQLEGVTKITSGKDGLILIEVDDKDPKHAAELANGYVDALFKFTNVLALTEASQRRLFFERQFAEAKENLVNAETAARHALQTSGLVKVDEQGRAMMEATARLRAQISVKEVQIGAMRTFAADRNPDLRFSLQELEAMKRELAQIEGAGGARSALGTPNRQGMESLRLLRDVKYYEVIFDLLARQYEMAKIDEAKEPAIIQVVDKAIAPDRKSKPSRRNFVVLCATASLFLALVWVFGREAVARISRDPLHAERLRALKRSFAWR